MDVQKEMFECVMEKWLEKDKVCYVSPASGKMYRHLVNLIEKYPFAKLPIEEINVEKTEGLLNSLYFQGYSKSTITKVKSTIYQVMQSHQLGNQVASSRIPAAPSRTVCSLTESQQKRLIEHLQTERLGDLYPFLLLTGLRRAELIALKWADYDDVLGVIHIRRSKTAAGVRTIPLVDQAKQIVERQPRYNCFIFNNTDGTPLTPTVMKRLYERLRQQTGIETLTNHVLRHTFATNLLERECPVQAITMFLGHANAKSTAPYLTPSATYLRNQIYRLNDEKLKITFSFSGEADPETGQKLKPSLSFWDDHPTEKAKK